MADERDDGQGYDGDDAAPCAFCGAAFSAGADARIAALTAELAAMTVDRDNEAAMRQGQEDAIAELRADLEMASAILGEKITDLIDPKRAVEAALADRELALAEAQNLNVHLNGRMQSAEKRGARTADTEQVERATEELWRLCAPVRGNPMPWARMVDEYPTVADAFRDKARSVLAAADVEVL